MDLYGEWSDGVVMRRGRSAAGFEEWSEFCE